MSARKPQFTPNLSYMAEFRRNPNFGKTVQYKAGRPLAVLAHRVRSTAAGSMRYRLGRTLRKSGRNPDASLPGTPPHAHKNIKRNMPMRKGMFAHRVSNSEWIVGPRSLTDMRSAPYIPKLHEKGGRGKAPRRPTVAEQVEKKLKQNPNAKLWFQETSTRPLRSERAKQAFLRKIRSGEIAKIRTGGPAPKPGNYPARPYMAPALKKTMAAAPEIFNRFMNR